jgi:hypothetical protein
LVCCSIDLLIGLFFGWLVWLGLFGWLVWFGLARVICRFVFLLICGLVFCFVNLLVGLLVG